MEHAALIYNFSQHQQIHQQKISAFNLIPVFLAVKERLPPG